MIIIAAIFAYLFKLFKQPLIPAYVVAGLIVGPIAMGLFQLEISAHIVDRLSEIGIAFLLFLVGMEIKFEKLKSVGKAATFGGAFVAFAMFIVMYLLALAFHVTAPYAFYVGLIFAFSSTMVVIKLLSDKKELLTLHGRIVVGRLLMEDVLAILVLTLLIKPEGAMLPFVLVAIAKAIGIIIGLYIFGKYILSPVLKIAASDQKLLFLISLGVVFFVSIVFQELGFSIAIGGFLAGLMMANTPFNVEIISHVKPLRDFFAILFFVALGMKIQPRALVSVLFPSLIFLIVFYITKPLLGFLAIRFLGYTKSTSFLSALSLTQISEFSLIIATAALGNRLISQEVFSITVLIAVITISATSYLIKYNFPIFKRLQNIISIFDFFKDKEKEIHYLPEDRSYDTLLIGCNRLGYGVLKKLRKMDNEVLVIDFNPEVINHLTSIKIQCMYGDIGDMEILDRINLKKLKLIISTVPDYFDNKLLIKEVHKQNRRAIIITTAETVDTALDLYNQGADYVVMPHLIGGEYLSVLLDDFTTDLRKLVDTKLAHVEELKSRKQIMKENHHFKLPL